MASSLEWALAAMTETRRDELAREAWAWPSSRYRDDPEAFAREVLGVETIWSKQIEILEAVRDHKRVAVRSGHKCSKSHSDAIVALWFYASFPDARVCMTSVTARQVDAILYREVRKLHANARRPLDGEPRELARSGIKAPDFREIVGFTAKEPEAVAGISGANVLYIVDEASGVAQEIFDAIEGNRAGGARLLLTSNPTQNEGEFFEAFHSKSRFYKTVHVSSEDTPNVVEGREVIPGLATKEWVDEKRDEWGEDSALYQVRVRGNFVTRETGKIFSLHLIAMSEARWEETAAIGRLQIGIDCAGPGEGGDETAFSATRGYRHLLLQAERTFDEEKTLERVLDLCRTMRAPGEVPLVVVDREGPIGLRVFRMLRAHLDEHATDFELVGVLSSKPAVKEPLLYATIRDELHAQAARWMREGGAVLADVKLTKELHAPQWSQAAISGPNHMKLKATPKRELMKVLGRSPDRGDAFFLSVWPVAVDVVQTDDGARAAADVQRERRRAELDDFGEGGSLDPYAGVDAWGRG